MKKGSVTTMLARMRSQDTTTLIERFKHIVGVRAIKSYIASKPDILLDIEVRLTEDELRSRLISNSTWGVKTLINENENII
jgi:hypothetical protein